MTYDIAKRIFVLDKLLRTYRSGLSNGPVFRIGGDEQLHDAFTRADQLMYDRKKELKSMGAKTRES